MGRTHHTKMATLNSQRYTLKFCLSKYKYDINVYNSENWIFSIVISLQKWLRIYTAGKHMEISTIKHF